ncbi:MAG: dihydroneopterin aldolase family protein [Promethearchaeota archaeon]
MPINNHESLFYSDLSERERACFETGIKLGALYHILCGLPISSNKDTVNSIERGIEASISCQPYVKSVKIKLDQNKIIGDKSTEFAYDEISGKIIKAEIEVEYKSIKVLAKVEWIEKLEYPLMYIEKIT